MWILARPAVWAGTVLVGVAVAYVAGVFDRAPDPVDTPVVAAVPPLAAPEPVPEPAPVPAPEASVSPEPTETAEPDVTDSAVFVPAPPRFDLVRVEPSGSTLVAGVAAAGSEVVVLLDNVEQDRAGADPQGKFVSFLDLGDSTEPRVLRLKMLADGQEIESEDEVIIAPSLAAVSPSVVADAPDQPVAAGQGSGAALVALSRPQGASPVPGLSDPSAPGALPSVGGTAAVPGLAETARAPVPGRTGPVSDVTAAVPGSLATVVPADETLVPETAEPGVIVAQPAPADPSLPQPEAVAAAPDAPRAPASALEPAAPAAPTVILSSREGVRVLQQPSAPDQGPVIPTPLELGAISYDGSGNVFLSGRGDGASVMRIYLNNRLITDTTAGADGAWRTQLSPVEPGVYTLRVDQVDAQGKVTARVESPFKREAPELLVAASAAPVDAEAPPVRAITVQPGSTLWAIARDRYGDGIEYVRVFEANRDSIRDPDLIYPGQIFDLPD